MWLCFCACVQPSPWWTVLRVTSESTVLTAKVRSPAFVSCPATSEQPLTGLQHVSDQSCMFHISQLLITWSAHIIITYTVAWAVRKGLMRGFLLRDQSLATAVVRETGSFILIILNNPSLSLCCSLFKSIQVYFCCCLCMLSPLRCRWMPDTWCVSEWKVSQHHWQLQMFV